MHCKYHYIYQWCPRRRIKRYHSIVIISYCRHLHSIRMMKNRTRKSNTSDLTWSNYFYFVGRLISPSLLCFIYWVSIRQFSFGQCQLLQWHFYHRIRYCYHYSGSQLWSWYYFHCYWWHPLRWLQMIIMMHEVSLFSLLSHSLYRNRNFYTYVAFLPLMKMV